tara:strand:+ start:1301 stop:1777 length:477 start_codon:yes stop_codon:yes gene_type:complete
MIELPDHVLHNTMMRNMKKHVSNEQIIKLISNRLTDSDKGLLLSILLEEITPYRELQINDVVSFTPDKYDISNYGDLALLTDAKLYSHGEMIGIIIDSDTYGANFDNYSSKMKLKSIICKDGEYSIYSSSINIFNIKILKCVPTTKHFKNKYVSLQTG